VSTDSKQKNNEYYKKYSRTPKGRFSKYKRGAKARGYDFDLEFEFLDSILNQGCHYCGAKNSNGLDRVDNNKGYTTENIVPCCKTCNFMKGSLDYKSFIKQIKLISKNLT